MEKKSSASCEEFDECMKVLNVMLDNEASPEEESYLKEHLEKCMVCFEQYEVEKQIREMIRAKVQNLPIPANLEDDIRTKIRMIA